MFHTRASASGQLAGLLVGSRRDDSEDWRPALDVVTVEAVIVHGVSLHIGPWQDLIADGDIGWPVFGTVRAGQTLVVYVRNDERELRELRAVLVMHGERKERRLRISRHEKR